MRRLLAFVAAFISLGVAAWAAQDAPQTSRQALMEMFFSDGFGAAEANQHQAMLIGSSLASGKHFGYSFTLTGCVASSHFRLTAIPIGESNGRRTFCSDETGAIRASADGNLASCTSGGNVIP